jgi:hypothetical protein
MEIATLSSELAKSKEPTPLPIALTPPLINNHTNSCPTPTIAGHMATPSHEIIQAKLVPVPKKNTKEKPHGRITWVPPKEEEPGK